MNTKLILKQALIRETLKMWKSQKASVKTISIFVRNPLEGEGQWVDLPIAESELDEIMDGITFEGERDYEIADYEGISKLPTQSPWKLNELAEELNTPEDVEKFEFLLDQAHDIDTAIQRLRMDAVAIYDSKFDYISQFYDNVGETWDTDRILGYIGRIPDLRDMVYDELRDSFYLEERNGRIFEDIEG